MPKRSALRLTKRIVEWLEAAGLPLAAPLNGGPTVADLAGRPERSRGRFPTDAEFARLGRVLEETAKSGTVSPMAAAAIRLLMRTGCRKS